MDYLSSIKVFIAVAESGSCHKAAKKLCKTEAAISKKLKKLEDFLSTTLIVRDKKGILLTPIGEEYLLACKDVLAKVIETQSVISSTQAHKNMDLKIHINHSLLEQHILPKVKDFLQLYPQANLEIITNNADMKHLTETMDIIIGEEISKNNFSKHSGEQWVRKKLGMSRQVICASPEYLKQHALKKNTDLSSMNYLSLTTADASWVLKHFKEITVSSSLKFDNSQSMLDAALHGLGFMLASEHLVKKYIQAKQLIEVLPCEVTLPFYVYYKHDKYPKPLIKDFINLFFKNIPDFI